MDIKDLNFTEQDFELLVEGLDSLPEKGLAGQMMGELFSTLMLGDKPGAIEEYKRKREVAEKQRELLKRQKMEDVRILQGKLLQLKRYMAQLGALKQVNDILETPLNGSDRH